MHSVLRLTLHQCNCINNTRGHFHVLCLTHDVKTVQYIDYNLYTQLSRWSSGNSSDRGHLTFSGLTNVLLCMFVAISRIHTVTIRRTRTILKAVDGAKTCQIENIINKMM